MEEVRLRRIFLPHPLIDVRHFHSICMQILWESRATVVWPAAWPLPVLHHPKRPVGAPAGSPSSRHAVESRALQAKLSPVVDATDQAYARLAPCSHLSGRRSRRSTCRPRLGSCMGSPAKV